MEYLFLVIGFALLIIGAYWLVDGASSLATLIKIPKAIMGLSVVAIGTSLPETAVSITAALEGNSEMAIANVVGSNIFNILMITGICALIKVLPSNNEILKRDFPWAMSSTIILIIILADVYISRIDGVILIICMAIYLFMMQGDAEEQREGYQYIESHKYENTIQNQPAFKSTLLIIIGLVFVVIGGKLVVDDATVIAVHLGMSQTLMGLTVVAIGTSLPELVTSIVAVRKGEADLAIGNIIGSNIFNGFVVLGASALCSPLRASILDIADVGLMLIATGVVYFFSWHNDKTTRSEAVACIGIYIAFLVYIFLR